MWGKQGHGEPRGQICSRSGGTGAQQLRVQSRRAAEMHCSGQVQGDLSAGVKAKSGVLSARAGGGCSG